MHPGPGRAILMRGWGFRVSKVSHTMKKSLFTEEEFYTLEAAVISREFDLFFDKMIEKYPQYSAREIEAVGHSQLTSATARHIVRKNMDKVIAGVRVNKQEWCPHPRCDRLAHDAGEHI